MAFAVGIAQRWKRQEAVNKQILELLKELRSRALVFCGLEDVLEIFFFRRGGVQIIKGSNKSSNAIGSFSAACGPPAADRHESTYLAVKTASFSCY